MRRLSRRTLLTWAGLGAVVPGCISPTLPLPPPSAPDGTDLGNGTYRLIGSVPIVSTVLIRNRRTSAVVGLSLVMAYDLIVAAEKGDVMVLWYETEQGDISSPVLFQIDRINPIIGDGGF